MSNLDKSWITQADTKSEKTWDNVYYWGYIEGASDFQKAALNKLKCELDIYTKGNAKHAYVAKICFEGAIQILKDLKPIE